MRGCLFPLQQSLPPPPKHMYTSIGRNGKCKSLLVLLTVPLTPETFEVAAHYVYAVQPPVPSLLFPYRARELQYNIMDTEIWYISTSTLSTTPTNDGIGSSSNQKQQHQTEKPIAVSAIRWSQNRRYSAQYKQLLRQWIVFVNGGIELGRY